MVREFDIWAGQNGELAVREVQKVIVNDADAPLGYSSYKGRITANNKSDALQKFASEFLRIKKAS